MIENELPDEVSETNPRPAENAVIESEASEIKSRDIEDIVDRYIEKSGYGAVWKFKKYCGDKTGIDIDSAASKYRVKVFTFYMKDLIPVITELYEFNYQKLYDVMTEYRDFFVSESGGIDRNLLVKASYPIIKKMIAVGILKEYGEGYDAVFQSTVIEEPLPQKDDYAAACMPDDIQEDSASADENETNSEPVSESEPPDPDSCTEQNDLSPAPSDQDENDKSVPKSKIPVIAAAILISVMVITALSGGLLLIYKNRPKPDNSNSISPEAEAQISVTSVSSDLTSKTPEATTTVTTQFVYQKKPVSNKEKTDLAFGKFLGKRYNELIAEENNAEDFSDNAFAVYDVDNDGSEELLISMRSASAGSNKTFIYKYDENDNVSEQGSVYYDCVFYENGSIEENNTDNTELASKFQPYTSYSYNREKDKYDMIGSVYAWNKSEAETDSNGEPYPEKADTSSSGYVYYISAEEYDKKTPVDVTVYKKWRSSWIGNEKELKLKYLEFTPENIKLYDPEFEYEEKVDAEYIGVGYVNVDSDGLDLRKEPNDDSEVYTKIPNNAAVTLYSTDSSDWYYAYYKNYKGYVNSEYIIFSSDNSSSDESIIPNVDIGMTIDQVMEAIDCTRDQLTIEYGTTFNVNGSEVSKTTYYLYDSSFTMSGTDIKDIPAVMIFEFTDNGNLWNFGYHIGTADFESYPYSLTELKKYYNKIRGQLDDIYGHGKQEHELEDYGIDTEYQWDIGGYKNVWMIVGEKMWGTNEINEITLSCSDPSLL
ncbi:MAG: SH3 domain-containing protein [Clostridium sp.]|nr:SH3 domain-containing protein [Clostridium sp.]MCM1547741.1 SH3 domain-containing protein [Ruminococcus sp.]